MDPKIFITYSSKDQKVAQTVCTALENRGLACWISVRNVRPGQNYQEQIVRAIRAAKVMVLVFTTNANNSNEIKKEIALASQNNLIVIPVRIEDVAPNEALTYEFATRQWIDLFDNWENAIGQLTELIAGILDEDPNTAKPAAASPPPPSPPPPTPPPSPRSDTAPPMGFMSAPAAKPAAAAKSLPPWLIPGGATAAVLAAAVVALVVFTRPSPVPTPPAPTPIPSPTPTPTPTPLISTPTPPSPSPSPSPSSGQTYGSLAIALPSDVAKDGFSYGYAINKSDAESAEARALELCQTTKDASTDANLRGLCKVVQDYSNKCVAVAMDPAAGTPGVGWSIAANKSTAEKQAMNKCMDTAGPGRRAACVISHSDCDGNAQ